MPLGVGKLSDAKKDRLLAIRNSILSLMEDMLERCFVEEPLYAKHSQKTIDAMLCSMEKAHKGVNAVWKQMARTQVKPMLANGLQNYYRRLAGSLRNVDQKVPSSCKIAGNAIQIMPNLISPLISFLLVACLFAFSVAGNLPAVRSFVPMSGNSWTFDLSNGLYAGMAKLHEHNLEDASHRRVVLGEVADYHQVVAESRVPYLDPLKLRAGCVQSCF